MKHSETISAIAESLALAQAEYVPVPKTKTARVKTKAGYEYTYMYADLADILAMAIPRLAKQGIAFTQPHILDNGKLRVVTHLFHKSGEWMQSDGIEISEDGDPQQFGAESTYFRRYDGASFIGVAPDEDTDAQQAGTRTKRTTPAEVDARLQQENAFRPTTTAQSSQQAIQRSATATEAAQPQAGVLKFSPPDGLTVVVKSVRELAGLPAKPANGNIPAMKAIRPSLRVTFLGLHNGVSEASCFDTGLWPAIKDAVGLECHFQIKEKDSNSKHYINIEDVLYVDGVPYVDGKPAVDTTTGEVIAERDAQ
jgi:hypothetical protein